MRTTAINKPTKRFSRGPDLLQNRGIGIHSAAAGSGLLTSLSLLRLCLSLLLLLLLLSWLLWLGILLLHVLLLLLLPFLAFSFTIVLSFASHTLSPSSRSNLRFSILSSQREGSFFGRAGPLTSTNSHGSHQFISVRVFSFKHGSHHHIYASTIIYSTNHQFLLHRNSFAPWMLDWIPSSKIHKMGEHVQA